MRERQNTKTLFTHGDQFKTDCPLHVFSRLAPATLIVLFLLPEAFVIGRFNLSICFATLNLKPLLIFITLVLLKHCSASRSYNSVDIFRALECC